MLKLPDWPPDATFGQSPPPELLLEDDELLDDELLLDELLEDELELLLELEEDPPSIP